MSSPYTTPADLDPGTLPAIKLAVNNKGLVGHVRVLAILMIVSGGLELFLAAIFVVLSFAFPTMFAAFDQNQQPPRPNSPDPKVFVHIVGGVYLAVGGVIMAVSLLRIYAGFRLFRFRNRVVGISSLVFGLTTSLTLYCIPISVGLLIYGLIVLLDKPVAAAFELGAQGYTGDQILSAFEDLVAARAGSARSPFANSTPSEFNTPNSPPSTP
ncbi:MAG: hypothetical protein FJ295_07295 [Planctomycetes bacterium]|nr:hypothetical protein [Planctomycetota bacterium]